MTGRALREEMRMLRMIEAVALLLRERRREKSEGDDAADEEPRVGATYAAHLGSSGMRMTAGGTPGPVPESSSTRIESAAPQWPQSNAAASGRSRDSSTC